MKSLMVFAIFACYAGYCNAKCCEKGDDKVGTIFCDTYDEVSPEDKATLEHLWGKHCERCTEDFCYEKDGDRDKKKFFIPFSEIEKRKFRLANDKRKFRLANNKRKYRLANDKRKLFLLKKDPESASDEDLGLIERPEDKRKFRLANDIEKRKFFRGEKRKFFRGGEKRKFFHGEKRSESDEESDELEEVKRKFRFADDKRGKPNALRFRRDSSEESRGRVRRSSYEDSFLGIGLGKRPKNIWNRFG